MEIISTRLRYVSASSLDTILMWVNNLPYKVEVKGNPVVRGKEWYLFFVLPENPALKEITSGKLD